MKIDLECKNPDLTVGDLKLGDVFQVKATRVDHYLVVSLFTPHVKESEKRDTGTVVLGLRTNQVMKLASNLPVILIPDAVITNKGK